MSGGHAVVSHESGKDFILTSAPDDGTYDLFDTYLDSSPKRSVALMKGSQLGFTQSGGGGLSAVAGRKKFPLSEGNYIWKKRK